MLYLPPKNLIGAELLTYMVTNVGPYCPWPFSVRFTVKVSPKNGAPPSIIIKTFGITPEFRNWPYWEI